VGAAAARTTGLGGRATAVPPRPTTGCTGARRPGDRRRVDSPGPGELVTEAHHGRGCSLDETAGISRKVAFGPACARPLVGGRGVGSAGQGASAPVSPGRVRLWRAPDQSLPLRLVGAQAPDRCGEAPQQRYCVKAGSGPPCSIRSGTLQVVMRTAWKQDRTCWVRRAKSHRATTAPESSGGQRKPIGLRSWWPSPAADGGAQPGGLRHSALSECRPANKHSRESHENGCRPSDQACRRLSGARPRPSGCCESGAERLLILDTLKAVDPAHLAEKPAQRTLV